jgi:hypothetical protein
MFFNLEENFLITGIAKFFLKGERKKIEEGFHVWDCDI